MLCSMVAANPELTVWEEEELLLFMFGRQIIESTLSYRYRLPVMMLPFPDYTRMNRIGFSRQRSFLTTTSKVVVCTVLYKETAKTAI